MSFSPRLLRTNRGQLTQGLMLVGILTTVMAGIASLSFYLSRMTRKKIQATRETVESVSSVETLILAYRLAEIKYVDAVQNCGVANPLLRALKEGAGPDCDIDVILFDPASQDLGTKDGVYSFLPGGGCEITSGASSCATGKHELIQVTLSPSPDRAVANQSNTYRMTLSNVVPQRHLIEFNATRQEGKKQSKFAFALISSLPNAVHLEQDGRVTQENPDPLSFCEKQKQWAGFQLYDPTSRSCQSFVQLGSGTGLAFYDHGFFGFRPMDGQVVDLLSATDLENSSYLVNEDGTENGVTVFPRYSKSELVNVDDITVIGEQIYYVAFSGANAQIGVLQDSGGGVFHRKRLCPAGQNLGELGWGQSYEGIAALSSSTPLLPVADDGIAQRLATFYLKTSGGDLLTAVIRGGAQGAPYRCSVFKDADLQQLEYRRTNGFDRTDTAKPYILY